MNLNELFSVSPSKVEALLAKIARLNVDIKKIQEQFARGGGPGGQKINKTSNVVILTYEPLQLLVRVQRERQRNVNRFLALRELMDQIEIILSPGTSPRIKEWKKIRKQKDRRQRRSTQL